MSRGTAIFALRKDFDYYKYIEERSHFDRLSTDIDTSISELVRKVNFEQYSLPQNIVENLLDVTRDGFSRLEIGLSGIQDSIDLMNLNLTTALRDIGAGIDKLNTQVGQLKYAVENPERVWAYEQFELANQSFSAGLVPEAAAALDRAINGNGMHSGHPTDWRFHYLLGHCYLGGQESTVKLDRDAIDLKLAKESFEKAVRMSSLEDEPSRADAIKAGALAWAGWACYCSGDFEDSALYFETAYTTINTPDSAYGLMKSCLALRTPSRAEQPFLQAIWDEPSLLDRAARDPDFTDNRDSVLSMRIKLVEAKIDELRNMLRELENLETQDFLRDAAKWDSKNSVHVDKFSARVRQLGTEIGAIGSEIPLDALWWRLDAWLASLREPLENLNFANSGPRKIEYDRIKKTATKLAREQSAPFLVRIGLKKDFEPHYDLVSAIEQRLKDSEEAVLRPLSDEIDALHVRWCTLLEHLDTPESRLYKSIERIYIGTFRDENSKEIHLTGIYHDYGVGFALGRLRSKLRGEINVFSGFIKPAGSPEFEEAINNCQLSELAEWVDFKKCAARRKRIESEMSV